MEKLPNEIIVWIISRLQSQRDYYNFSRINSRIGCLSISFNNEFKERFFIQPPLYNYIFYDYSSLPVIYRGSSFTPYILEPSPPEYLGVMEIKGKNNFSTTRKEVLDRNTGSLTLNQHSNKSQIIDRRRKVNSHKSNCSPPINNHRVCGRKHKLKWK